MSVMSNPTQPVAHYVGEHLKYGSLTEGLNLFFFLNFRLNSHAWLVAINWTARFSRFYLDQYSALGHP